MASIFKRYIALLLIFIGIVLLWEQTFILPLKIFVVFMHEVSHALAAVATGGRIVEIQVNPQQGGHALIQGGNRFLTLTAGYLGSLLWGGLILLLAARTRHDKKVSTVIGIGMIAISLGFGEGMFTYLFGIGFGAALVAIGFYLPERFNDWVLRIIGVTSCLYAILDIKSDVLDRSHLESDARMLAKETPPIFSLSEDFFTLFWGGVWIVIAVALTFWFLYLAGKAKPATPAATESDSYD